LPKDIDARKYYRVAKQRLEEAKVILTKVELPAAAEYLGGYAVECMLKALIIVTTPPSERPPPGDKTVKWWKKEIGHYLELMRAAVRKRCGKLPPDVTSALVYVATWHPEQRYEPGPGDPAKATRFLAEAETIVKWADQRM